MAAGVEGLVVGIVDGEMDGEPGGMTPKPVVGAVAKMLGGTVVPGAGVPVVPGAGVPVGGGEMAMVGLADEGNGVGLAELMAWGVGGLFLLQLVIANNKKTIGKTLRINELEFWYIKLIFIVMLLDFNTSTSNVLVILTQMLRVWINIRLLSIYCNVSDYWLVNQQ